MANGGANSPAPPSDSGGEFLLSLLHRRPSQGPPDHHHQQQSSFSLDPAIAAVGPTVNHFPPSYNGRERPGTLTSSSSPWPMAYSPPNLLGFSQFPNNPFPVNHQFDGNQRVLAEDAYRLGFNGTGNHSIQNQELVFGSFDATRSLLTGNSNHHQSVVSGSNSEPNLLHFRNHEQRGGFSGRGNYGAIGNNNNGRGLKSTPLPPPGFSSNQRGWDRDNFQRNQVDLSAEEDRLRSLSIQSESSRYNLGQQIDHPGPPMGAKSLHSVSGADAVDSFSMLKKEGGGGGEYKEELGKFSKGKKNEGNGEFGAGDDEIEDFGEDIVESLLLDDETEDKDAKDDKKSSRIPREKVKKFMIS